MTRHLLNIGFAQGVGHPCVFEHKGRGLKTLIHGDDYCSSGYKEDLDWLQCELEKEFELNTQISSARKKSEGHILNRIVRHTSDGWEMEADPRHAELIIEQLLNETDKAVSTPGVDDNSEKVNQESTARELEGEEISVFRGIAARCNYLSIGRPDIQYAAKEACRDMSKPTTASVEKVRRIAT